MLHGNNVCVSVCTYIHVQNNTAACAYVYVLYDVVNNASMVLNNVTT